MLPYLIPLFATLMGIIFYDASGRTLNRKWLYYGIGVYITLLFGLRYRIGWDTLNYMEFYSTFPDLSHFDEAFAEKYDFMQPGFKLLWMITRSISDEFWVFQIVHCTFVNSVVLWFMKNHTRYWFTNLFLYLICYCMYYNTEIMRESIAICIFLLSYKYMVTGKYLKYYICVGIAILFHVSATLLLFYPVMIWLKVKFDKRFFIFILVAMVVLIMARSYVLNIAGGLGGLYGDRLVIYSAAFMMGKMNNNWLIQRIIQFVIAPICFFVVYKFILKKEVKFESMICLYILFGLGIFIFYEISVRFANYPTPLYLIAVGSLIGQGIRKTSRMKAVSYFALSAIIVLYMYGPITLNIATHGMTPYSWVLNPKKDKLREFFSGVDNM